MTDISILFNESIEWIRANYADFRFFVERDFVWTVQKHLSSSIRENSLPYMVWNDYPVEPGPRRSICVDLAVIGRGITYTDILNGNACAELAAEFKFEPSKRRVDVGKQKLPVVGWEAVIEDITRIKRFTENGVTTAGIAVLVDEFGQHRWRNVSMEHSSKWLDWGSYNTDEFNVSVLWTRIGC